MAVVSSLRGQRVYLDTNVFIYALSGFSQYATLLAELLEAMEAGAMVGVTSELALAEALVMPLRRNSAEEEQRCREMFQPGAGLELWPVTMAVLEQMARMRAANPAVRTPDAIHAATAQLARCDAFLTNDARLKVVPGLQVILLGEVAP